MSEVQQVVSEQAHPPPVNVPGEAESDESAEMRVRLSASRATRWSRRFRERLPTERFGRHELPVRDDSNCADLRTFEQQDADELYRSFPCH